MSIPEVVPVPIKWVISIVIITLLLGVFEDICGVYELGQPARSLFCGLPRRARHPADYGKRLHNAKTRLPVSFNNVNKLTVLVLLYSLVFFFSSPLPSFSFTSTFNWLRPHHPHTYTNILHSSRVQVANKALIRLMSLIRLTSSIITAASPSTAHSPES